LIAQKDPFGSYIKYRLIPLNKTIGEGLRLSHKNKADFFRIILYLLKKNIVLGKKFVDIHGINYRYSTKNYRYF